MCKAIFRAQASLHDKVISRSPFARMMEKKYGIRPHTSTLMLGRAAGRKDPNKFYQPGGGGYTEPNKGGSYAPPVHSLRINSRKIRTGG